MTVLKVCYKSGVRLDQAYYLSTHAALAGSVMGSHGVQRVEIVKFAPGPDGAMPPYQLMLSAHFESAAALQNAMQDPRMPEVLADIRNFYDGMPDLLIGEIVDIPRPA